MASTRVAAAVDRVVPVGRGRGLPGVGLLTGLLALAVLCSICIGAAWVSPLEFFGGDGFQRAVLLARLERTGVALAVGAALGLGGGCLQGLTRNPLADPGLLGLNAGAAFAVVGAISWLGATGLQHQLWFAFAGAAAAAVAVHGIAAFGPGGATPAKLVLAGAALTAGLTSWTSAILLTDHKTFDVFRRWQVGMIRSDIDLLVTGAPFLALGMLLALARSRVLDALALGDDLARGLGRHTGLDRLTVGLAVVLLVGTATAIAGPIAFVGLVVPHAVRVLVGSSYAKVLPLSVVAGATLVTLADTLGRVVLPPQEVQVGIMTAVVGVPAFVWFLKRGRLAGL